MGEFSKSIGTFVEKRAALMKMLADLAGREAPYANSLDFFGGEPEVQFAVLLQNCLQPKNSNRTEAIKAGIYVEIETVE